MVSALLAAGADRNVPTPAGFTRPALLTAGADKKRQKKIHRIR